MSGDECARVVVSFQFIIETALASCDITRDLSHDFLGRYDLLSLKIEETSREKFR